MDGLWKGYFHVMHACIAIESQLPRSFLSTLSLSAVSCPAGSVGPSIGGGCVCNNALGYYGNITATSTPPYYSGTCLQYNSCKALLLAAVGTVTGVYNVLYGSTAYPVYCDQVTNGGGWELVMKMSTTAGAIFGYHSAIWSTGSTFNTNSLDETNTDAVFPQFAAGSYSQVREWVEGRMDRFLSLFLSPFTFSIGALYIYLSKQSLFL